MKQKIKSVCDILVSSWSFSKIVGLKTNSITVMYLSPES